MSEFSKLASYQILDPPGTQITDPVAQMKQLLTKPSINMDNMQLLNSPKTLVSRASSVLLQNFGESNACILLETKFSPYRQNFDYYHWKNYID